MRGALLDNLLYLSLQSNLNWMAFLLELTVFLQPRVNVQFLDSETFQVPPRATSSTKELGQMNEKVFTN